MQSGWHWEQQPNKQLAARPGNYAPAPRCSRCLNAQLSVVHEQTARIANLPKSYELRAPLGQSYQDNVGFGVAKAAIAWILQGETGLVISASQLATTYHLVSAMKTKMARRVGFSGIK